MTKRFNPDRDVAPYPGPWRRYDILKEGTIAFVVIAILATLLSVLFSSPDAKAITIQQWGTAQPLDFATTAMTELDGTSGTATYGAPYNHNGLGQNFAGFSPAKFVGVHLPIDTAWDFVLHPVSTLPDNPVATGAVKTYLAASAAQQATWNANYENAIAKNGLSFTAGQLVVDPKYGPYGPVSTIISAETSMARSGALDTSLIAGQPFYTTNYTKPLLFLADGTYLAGIAQAEHLTGDQWGVMNEAGNFPGQAWLWLYTAWYQWSPISNSDNADLWVFVLMGVVSAGLLFVPFIPGLRSIPRWTRVYKLIWREHYRGS